MAAFGLSRSCARALLPTVGGQNVRGTSSSWARIIYPSPIISHARATRPVPSSSSLNRRRRSGTVRTLIEKNRKTRTRNRQKRANHWLFFFFPPPSFTHSAPHEPPRLVDLRPPVCVFVFLVWSHTIYVLYISSPSFTATGCREGASGDARGAKGVRCGRVFDPVVHPNSPVPLVLLGGSSTAVTHRSVASRDGRPRAESLPHRR